MYRVRCTLPTSSAFVVALYFEVVTCCLAGVPFPFYTPLYERRKKWKSLKNEYLEILDNRNLRKRPIHSERLEKSKNTSLFHKLYEGFLTFFRRFFGSKSNCSIKFWYSKYFCCSYERPGRGLARNPGAQAASGKVCAHYTREPARLYVCRSVCLSSELTMITLTWKYSLTFPGFLFGV